MKNLRVFCRKNSDTKKIKLKRKSRHFLIKTTGNNRPLLIGNLKTEVTMKYLIAWLLGVPLGLLVLIWLVSHIF